MNFYGVKAHLEYSHIRENFGALGQLANDFFTLGRLGMLALKGPLFPQGGLSWILRGYLGEELVRGLIGVSYSGMPLKGH